MDTTCISEISKGIFFGIFEYLIFGAIFPKMAFFKAKNDENTRFLVCHGAIIGVLGPIKSNHSTCSSFLELFSSKHLNLAQISRIDRFTGSFKSIWYSRKTYQYDKSTVQEHKSSCDPRNE